MRIQLLHSDTQSDYTFQISENNKILLSSASKESKAISLERIQKVLITLRENEQISMQSSINNTFYFQVTEYAKSPSFGDIEEASDVLAKLKEFSQNSLKFTVIYDKSGENIVSKKQLGLREESYNFSKKSTSGKSGFELIEEKTSNGKYFHFNDANGNALLFSRFYDGKTRRIKAIRSLIKNASNKSRYEFVNQIDNYFFIIKTSKGYEVARSRSFSSIAKMKAGLAFLKAQASINKKDFKIRKKKKKNQKAKEKYHLKQIAPFGLIGFEGFKNQKNKLHYFHYHNEGGQALLVSRPYKSRKNRDKAIAFVMKNGSKKKYFKIKKKSKHKHYFSIIGKDGKSFARSRYFHNKEAMSVALEHLKNNANGFNKEVNVASTIKQKKFIIELPQTVTTISEKKPIAIIKKEKPVAAIPIKVEEPEVESQYEPILEDILPQPGIKIESEPLEESIAISDPNPPPIPEPVYKSDVINEKEIFEKKENNGFPWKWILLALAAVAILSMLYGFCNTQKTKSLPSPEPKIEQVIKEVPPPAPTKLGPTATELNYSPTTAEGKMADFLSSPKGSIPKTFLLESIQFPFNSAVLVNTSDIQLSHVAAVMQAYPKVKIDVNGHTDSRGENTLNLVLSQNRAIAVQNYLIGKGIAANRINNATGYGENQPISSNDTDQGRQMNRRSEVVIIER